MHVSKPSMSEISANTFDCDFENLSTARRVLIQRVSIIFEKAGLKD